MLQCYWFLKQPLISCKIVLLILFRDSPIGWTHLTRNIKTRKLVMMGWRNFKNSMPVTLAALLVVWINSVSSEEKFHVSCTVALSLEMTRARIEISPTAIAFDRSRLNRLVSNEEEGSLVLTSYYQARQIKPVNYLFEASRTRTVKDNPHNPEIRTVCQKS